MNYIVVRYNDPEGLTREWANGPVENSEAIHKLAAEHLALYREEKRKVRDPLATAEFTVEEEVVNE